MRDLPTKNVLGSVAQHTAMIAVMSVTKIIASALGPKSRTKLIQCLMSCVFLLEFAFVNQS